MTHIDLQSSAAPQSGCAGVAGALPLLHLGLLDAADEDDVREHLAGCDACRARLRAYDALDSGIRRYAGALETVAPAPADLMRAATEGQRAAPVRISAGMSPTDVPPSAAVPDAERRLHPRSHPALAVLAASLLIAMSVALFGMLPLIQGITSTKVRPTQTTVPTATPTLLPATPLNLPSNTALWDISMSSPDDGWAAGHVLPPSDPSQYHTVLLHYHRGQWTVSDQTFPSLHVESISMVSESEGWAAGWDKNGGVFLHFAGGRWTVVPLPQRGTLYKVQMLSVTDGWALGEPKPPAQDPNCPTSCTGMGVATPSPSPTPQAGPWGLYHYVGGAWHDVALPDQLDATSSWSAQHADLAMLSSNDGWMVFGKYILRYQGDIWRIAYTLDDPTGFYTTYSASLYPKLTMLSDRDGWLVTADATNALAVLRFDGAGWALVPLPQDPDFVRAGVSQIAANHTGDAWLFEGTYGLPDPNAGKPVALHYTHGAWSRVDLPPVVKVYRFALVSDTEGWAVCWANPDRSHPFPWVSEIYHYQNGAWAQYPS